MLALELALTHRVPATLVEPKPLRLNKAYQKRVKKWRRLTTEAAEGVRTEAEGAGEEEQGDEEGAEGVDEEEQGDEEGAEGAEEEEPAEEQGAEAEGPEELDPVRHIQSEFHGLHGSADNVVAALHSAGTVLGMHPDIPTGHIVDAAIALGKPPYNGHLTLI